MTALQNLATELQKAQYTALSDDAAADAVNAASVTVSVPINAHDVRRYLSTVVDDQNRSKWAVITLTSDGLLSSATDSNKPAARALVEALADFATFDLTDPAVMQAVAGQLDLVAAAGLITGPHDKAGTDAANIIALGTGSVPLWQALGFTRALDWGDIHTARGGS